MNGQSAIAERPLRVLQGKQALADAVATFVPSGCYFPADVIYDTTKFVMKFVVAIAGAPCNFFLGFLYEGKGYVFTELDGVPGEIDTAYSITFLETTLKNFFENPTAPIPAPTQSKTITLDFKCGYVTAEGDHIITDSWPANCYVQVGGKGFFAMLPWWAWAGLGVVVVGGGGYLLLKKK